MTNDDDNVGEIKLAGDWLNKSQRPVKLKDVETGTIYHLKLLPGDVPADVPKEVPKEVPKGVPPVTASIRPGTFIPDTTQNDDYDPREIPVTIDELRAMAEAVYCRNAPAYLLWEMRQRRGQ